ncbi:alpha/beta hydrolase [bacterium (Candidatus Blackallbacteria) CG17_big_fil_post_rev_8_21_14_2_50_48_46]|uniref:Alpha/beta hydrolase n=1 Tax=bacterium (Candidatus Blackallbacteria) CG17_big_fil_post_rev_8_21_14_2_50_48_46 TaxID=2014261 RepID=A0A2M7GBI3_9BACT|nr:MAG: esterase [bacterium (Candidatus Blackallbacteria) CG18_big_fil_WC_8_21_14_2_50_49_26]PIW19500.1 MAG: alpha/beta hydrolase [bacterium (Candidatus Blackallbacteria) CG17_big_fil_post_rev_8_21_14_2_50_48_46]PIW48896.1 MAG: alpha/beta hydrolase [bacterium (Candidatus Blackallbacteria) CG13_big_fil_rev_8_21_14_2_50_49_14]
MTSFVLVPGAWHGGWCWQRVLPHLHNAGHKAFALTLTGTGERAHLLSAQIDLSTHIEDLCALIENEELQDLILVGHSYAGMVITGAAARLQKKKPGLLKALIYLDAVVPYPGESWSSQQSPEVIQKRLEKAQTEGLGLAIPPPDAAVFGLKGADYDWAERRLTPQPLNSYLEPLVFDPELLKELPRRYILCKAPILHTLHSMHERVRQEPDWEIEELASGHDPMISAPEALTALLLKGFTS